MSTPSHPRLDWRLAAAAIALLVGTSACQMGGSAAGNNSAAADAGSGKGALGGSRDSGSRDNGSRTADSGDRRSDDRGDRDTQDGDRGSQPGQGGSQAGDREGTRGARDNYDRRVRIVNNTGETVIFLYGSPTSDNMWGRDRIPTMTLSDGSSTIVDFNDNNGECRYDLRAQLGGEDAREQRDVNICQIREWTLNPSGSTVR